METANVITSMRAGRRIVMGGYCRNGRARITTAFAWLSAQPISYVLESNAGLLDASMST